MSRRRKESIVKILSIAILLILLMEHMTLLPQLRVSAQAESTWKGWPQFLKDPQHSSSSEAEGPENIRDAEVKGLVPNGVVSLASFLEKAGSSGERYRYYPVVDANGTAYVMSLFSSGNVFNATIAKISIPKVVEKEEDSLLAIYNLGEVHHILPPALSPDQKTLYIAGITGNPKYTVSDAPYFPTVDTQLVLYIVNTETGSISNTTVASFGNGTYILSDIMVGDDGTVYVTLLHREESILPTSKRKISIAASNPMRKISIGTVPGVSETTEIYVYALDPDGTIKWSKQVNVNSTCYDVAGSRYSYAPVQLPNGNIALALADKILILKGSDGSEVATIDVSGTGCMLSDPTVDSEGNIYVAKSIWANSNMEDISEIVLAKYSVGDTVAETEWTIISNATLYETPIETVSSPLVVKNGTVYLAVLRALGDYSIMVFKVNTLNNETASTSITSANRIEYITTPIIDSEGTLYIQYMQQEETAWRIGIMSLTKDLSLISKKELPYIVENALDSRTYPAMTSDGLILVQFPGETGQPGLVILGKRAEKPYTPPSTGGGGGPTVPLKPRYRNYLLDLPFIAIDYDRDTMAVLGMPFKYKIHVSNIGKPPVAVLLAVHWPENHYEYVGASFSNPSQADLLAADLGRNLLLFEVRLGSVNTPTLSSVDVIVKLKLKPEAYRIPGNPYGRLMPGEDPASAIIVDPIAIVDIFNYIDLKMKLAREGYDLETPDGLAKLIEESVKTMALHNDEVIRKFLSLPEDVQLMFLNSMKDTQYEKLAQAFMIIVAKEDIHGALDEYFRGKAEHSSPVEISSSTHIVKYGGNVLKKASGSLLLLGKTLFSNDKPLLITKGTSRPQGPSKKPMQLIMYGLVEPETHYWSTVAKTVDEDAKLKKKVKEAMVNFAISLWDDFATGRVADTMFGELAGALNFATLGLVNINYAPFGNYECFQAGKKIGTATAAIETILAAAAARFGAGATIKLVTKGVGKEPIHWGIDVVTRGSKFYVDGTTLNVIHIGRHVEFGWHLGLFSFGNYKTYLHLYANRVVIPKILEGTGEIVFTEIPYIQLPRYLLSNGIAMVPMGLIGRDLPIRFSDGIVDMREFVSAMQQAGLLSLEIMRSMMNPALVIDATELYGPVGVASLDPNDIMAYPGKYVTLGERVSFIVHFENLENASAPAFNITVKAFLDKGFNMSSIRLGDVSHSDTLKYVEIDNATNTITWYFENITLPPNKNPPEGEGYVSFSIRVNGSLPLGYKLLSNAEVVFDYNPPLKTRTIEHIVDYAPPDPSEAFTVKMNGTVLEAKLNMSAYDPGGSGIKEGYVLVDGGVGNRVSVTLNETLNEVSIALSPSVNVYLVKLSVQDKAGNVGNSYLKIVNVKEKEKVQIGNVVVEKEKVVGKEIREYDATKCLKVINEYMELLREYRELRRQGMISLDIPLIPKSSLAYERLVREFGEEFIKYPSYPGRIQLLYATLYKEFKECLGEE